jgi:reactive intermediate/imine deaminase
MFETAPTHQVPRRRLLAGTAGAVLGATAAAAAGPHAADGTDPSGAVEQSASHTTRINPDTLAAPRGYSHVVVAAAGRTIYVSGQVPIDKTGALVGAGDLAAQTRQVFENVKAALAAAGATFGDVVKLTYFVTDASQVQVVRDVRDTFIDPARAPASTLVEVRRLVRQEFLVEIDAIAHVAG